MGCYPLGKMMRRTFRKCRGKGRRRPKMVRVHSPPPSYYCPAEPVANVATFHEDPVVVIPPEPNHSPTLTKHHPIPPAADVFPSAHSEIPQNKEPDRPRVRFAVGPEEHPEPDPRSRANPRNPSRQEPGLVYPGLSYGYAPSPLARWDEGERRRPEYFSGEYRCYPTPVRERIYSIATDANRLSTIFSEEDPNACSIV